jgi:hypothetical protein
VAKLISSSKNEKVIKITPELNDILAKLVGQ